MELPSPLADRLDDESVEALVSLGDEDALAVTSTRTLVYRAEGLLRDQSVAAYPHDVDRITCSVGRRRATVSMEYIDETRDLALPKDALDDALAPVLGGVLAAADVAEPGESVATVFRFSELTLVVTDRRVIKHVGTALWDDEHEAYDFAETTGLAVEEGTVATQVILDVAGRPQRIKVPSERARAVRRAIEEELLASHGADALGDLADDPPADPDEPPSAADATIEPLLDDPDAEAESGAAEADRADDGPLTDDADDDGAIATETDAGSDAETASAAATADADPDDATDEEDERDGSEEGGFRFGDPSDEEELAAQLRELTATVERQTELIERQRTTIERLVEELRRDR